MLSILSVVTAVAIPADPVDGMYTGHHTDPVGCGDVG